MHLVCTSSISNAAKTVTVRIYRRIDGWIYSILYALQKKTDTGTGTGTYITTTNNYQLPTTTTTTTTTAAAAANYHYCTGNCNFCYDPVPNLFHFDSTSFFYCRFDSDPIRFRFDSIRLDTNIDFAACRDRPTVRFACCLVDKFWYLCVCVCVPCW